MKRVGILGGTFDPPHLGHLVIAEEVRIALLLDEVWFIPSYEPPHKEKARTSSLDRIAMVNLAIDHNEAFKLNTIEVERLGKSYTFDTIRALNDAYPDIDFYFIIGADMVEYLPHWNRINDLIEIVNFVGVKRTGYNLNTDYPIQKIDIPMIDISSTLIRNRILTKKSIRYLVPQDVEAFIKGKRLYENK
ncbi:nicotinate-nucleotide adenylyltransferase [Virgibacillus oceani]|uniref:Probable nicotinate-nucleotide adenylyltransferase n=1 Tax=Virgibacillus oceani TaxID=1479511 RepID=A0A917H055_9BACI|nr:nicotinate-nucleotide adenylyltransferase [Virgibacillus oceani]GGG63163.1 putative nicotinate-nucleotide adenylyltransferase [Virgibacillus oceani]